VFNTPGGDLRIGLLPDFFLGAAYRFLHFLAAPDEVNGSPGEEHGDRIEVAAIGFEPKACRLEGYRAAAAEAVSHPRHVPKGFLRKLGKELLEAIGRGAQVRIDLVPGTGRRTFDFFGPAAVGELFFIGQASKGEGFKALFLCFAYAFSPARRLTRALDVPLALFGLYKAHNLFGGEWLILALPEAVLIHREDFVEYVAVLLWIVRGGHKQAQKACAHEDKRLAAPPLAEAGERLAGTRLALLVALRRKARDGELRFNEGDMRHEDSSIL